MAVIKQGTKGFVHCTYGMSDKLQKHLGSDSRFVFHDNQNKLSRYHEWRAAPPERGLIFVGCGLEEGIDLKGSDYGWQVVAKAQYASLAEPAVRYQAEHKSKEYVWDALRKCAQSCGRICRAVDDYGETYLVDSTFKKLFTQSKSYGMVPSWLDNQIVNKGELYE
jgi:Rad3-related DNA helicase